MKGDLTISVFKQQQKKPDNFHWLYVWKSILKKLIWHYVFRRELGVWSAPALHWLCESDTSARPSKEKSPESGFTHFCNCFLIVFWGARCPPELQQQKGHSQDLTVSFVNMCKSQRNAHSTAKCEWRGGGMRESSGPCAQAPYHTTSNGSL